MDYVLIKGAGDLATGVGLVFKYAGYHVLATEIEQPTCVRRKVSFAEAVYAGKICVHGIWGKLANNFNEAMEIINEGAIAILVDPEGRVLKKYPPLVYIDATIAKKNLGTSIANADMVIALGPGFEAGVDAHAVIETQRGPNLGKPIYKGMAAPDTGIPGDILGYTSERILRATADGFFQGQMQIGDIVEKGETVGFVNDVPVIANIGGVVRGLLKSGLKVRKGLKIGDIHPLKEPEVCFKVSDKSWAVGRGALNAVNALNYGIRT